MKKFIVEVNKNDRNEWDWEVYTFIHYDDLRNDKKKFAANGTAETYSAACQEVNKVLILV